MKKLAWTAALVIAVALLAQPREAAALDDFEIKPENKLAAAITKLADICFECADNAKGKGLYTYTRSFFNHALMYDPDHRKTRTAMGFLKKRGEWVLDEDLVPQSDKLNEARRDELTQKIYADTLAKRAKAVEPLWKFVEDKNLPMEHRLLALFHVIRINPEHRGAQKAAKSSPDRMWFKHQLDDVADTNRNVWIQRASAGEAVSDKTPYEEKSGIPMEKRRSDWIVFHADIGPEGKVWAEKLTQFGEASRNHVFELIGAESPAAPDKDEQRLHFTVLSERERFARFVESCSGITDASHRKEVATASGGSPVYNPYGSVWLYPRLENDYGLRDGIAHDIAAKEIFRYTGQGAYWLARGFGYFNSTHMNGSATATFFGVRTTVVVDSGGREALPGFGNCSAGWRLNAGLEVAGGAALTPGDLIKLGVNDYTPREMAQAYAYTDFLVNARKEKFKEFLESAYKERTRRHNAKEAAMTAAETLELMYTTLELTEAEFMAAFREWALASYFALP